MICVVVNGLLWLQGETYTLAKAQHTYKSLVKIHEKSGECGESVCLCVPPPPILFSFTCIHTHAVVWIVNSMLVSIV